MTDSPLRIALVGDRSPAVRAHVRIPSVLAALAAARDERIEPYWIGSEAVAGDGSPLQGFDAIWLVPGSPYLHPEGAITAARLAREQGIPFLGTCGGFQHALWEFARNVCGIADAAHAEYSPDAAHPVLVELMCSLVGHEREVRTLEGSLAAMVLGDQPTTQRYSCSYGLAPGIGAVLAAHGLVLSGYDQDGETRIFELPGHPFYLGTLFQPELAPDDAGPHPVIAAFVDAAYSRLRLQPLDATAG